jgi:hypothetical protein
MGIGEAGHPAGSGIASRTSPGVIEARVARLDLGIAGVVLTVRGAAQQSPGERRSLTNRRIGRLPDVP